MCASAALEGGVLTENGLLLNGVLCQAVIDKCDGCERIKTVDGARFCSSYPQPERKWKLGVCNFATHVKGTVDNQGKVKVNPLKASKRAARGR
jgi:hypothetical protein